ncbi:MAG: roadblock/LC7 domain-containing protein [candidate division WOR-3 bacterium]|nr:roadblock/LC7 domain-containing protein [candidate division WOR-3 bacterium]
MKSLILTPETLRVLEDSVNEYMVETRVKAVLIINTAGQVLFKRGLAKSDNFVQSVGALSAGIFNATVGLAKLLGDDYFDNIFQEGKRYSLFYSSLNKNTLLLAVYDRTALIGVIRVMTKKLTVRIGKLMMDEEESASSEFDSDYKDEVENLIDNMFK